MGRKTLFILIFFTAPVLAGAQVIATFEVALPKSTNGLNIPVSINLDNITFLADAEFSLVETTGNKKAAVPFQVSEGEHRTLHWQIMATTPAQKKYVYQLVKAPPKKTGAIIADNKDGAITFEAGNKNLLRYYFKTVYPPAGIDTSYKRSGFIHPLWTPNGQELTRIQPKDHYHHYGIWNPWTHVLFEKDTVDFWNLKDKKGTVRFSNFVAVTNGDVFAEFKALLEHVVFKKDARPDDPVGRGTEKVALHEMQTVRVYKPDNNSDYYIADFTSTLNCASQSPFHILAYRYGGFGWRTTEYWNNENCEVLTSEGKTRKDTDGSKAKWIIVQGALPGNDSGGAVMLSYPANYNHPEPLRIWTLNTNGRGDMFANFAPTKDKDWILQPGKTYVLKYRLVVFNGKFNAAKAESAWQYFATPPAVQQSRQ